MFCSVLLCFLSHQVGVQTYGGPALQINQQKCFFYGGPEKQYQLTDEIPSFESLSRKRLLCEQRFFLNNSNSKWLTMGIIPSTKILDKEAPGFHFEAILCGENKPSLPLGGIEGLASLFATIRQLPEFGNVLPSTHGISPSDNITFSTVDFAEEVSKNFVV